MEITLYCPFCEFEIKKELDDIDKGQTQTCLNCNGKFNIFTIYKSFYEDIPLAKKLSDIKISIMQGEYTVKGEENDVRIINMFFEENDFKNMFAKIVADCVIYGNSFIEKNEDTNRIIRYDAALCDIRTEWENRGGKIPSEVVSLIARDGRRVAPDSLIHFTNGQGSMPFGMSIFGFWLHTVYPLKLSAQALINASILKNRGLDPRGEENVKKIRKFFENEVMIGAGLPPALFSSTEMPAFLLESLALNAKIRRDHIVSTIERELFPFILKRKWEVHNYPEFHIKGHKYQYHEY